MDSRGDLAAGAGRPPMGYGEGIARSSGDDGGMTDTASPGNGAPPAIGVGEGGRPPVPAAAAASQLRPKEGEA